MDLHLSQKRVVVAAASKGLGFATARALVDEGAQVVICGRDVLALEEAVARLGPQASAIAVDLSDEGAAARFVMDATDRLGGIDALVTNGGGPPPATALQADLDAYRAAFEMNCLATIAMCSAAVPVMVEAGWGRIVAITSMSVREPIGNLVLSNVARSGVSAYLKSLARDVAASGVTVNSVQPGLHATNRLKALHGSELAGVTASVPVGHLGRPEDFGSVVAFLCSDQARFITGTSVLVDGGVSHGY